MNIFSLSLKHKIPGIIVLTLVILIGLFGGQPEPVRAVGFIVDSASDGADDANPGDGACATSLGECTLRAAIQETNALPGIDVITFDSDMTIYLLLGALPDITDSLVIDASNHWNTTTNQPGVVINGAGGSYSGLTLYTGANNCGIYGLEITNFDGSGIYIHTYGNIIGHSMAGNSNVLTSNSGAGIALVGTNAHDNAIQKNYIGVDTQYNKKGNFYGVYIAEGAYHNTIGGDSEEVGNLIAGNQDGIYIISDSTYTNYIGGNVIGGASSNPFNGLQVDIPGNTRHGIVINGSDSNQIGSATLAANGIMQNGSNGVYIHGQANLNDLIGNLIMGNGKQGIEITDSASGLMTENIISQNLENGIKISGATALGNQIFANTITQNMLKGIELVAGGNLELAAPLITSADDQSAAGTACANCMVTVHSDDGNQGTFYHGFVYADASGNWSFSGTIFGPNVTALAIDMSGNTSEFSVPQSIGGGTQQQQIFLPLLSK